MSVSNSRRSNFTFLIGGDHSCFSIAANMLSYSSRSMGLNLTISPAGDIVKFRPIEREEYDSILAAIEKHEWSPPIKNVKFDLREFETDIDAYNNNLVEVLYDD